MGAHDHRGRQRHQQSEDLHRRERQDPVPEGGNCAEPKVTRGGEDTVIIDVVCTTEQGKETISGAFTGDFSTRYRAQVKMTFDPPPKGMMPHIGVTIDGKYLGPDCGAEKAPGEAK